MEHSNKERSKKLGKKSVLVLSTLIIILVAIIFISSCIKKHNSSCIDRWKKDRVSDRAASDEALKWIIDAAEKKDKAAILSVFTEDIRKDKRIREEIDEFLEVYPGGFAEPDFDFKGGSSQEKIEKGKHVGEFHYSYEVVKDGQYFYIEIGGCHQNEVDSDAVGVKYFIFKSERAEVYYDDISEEPHYYKEYIKADIDVDGDFETRRVWGYPCKFYEIDRTITKEDIIQTYRNSEKIEDLIKKYGEPNSENLRLREVVYEIEPENGEPRYARITYDYFKHIVGDLQITGETQEDSEWIE